MLAPAACGDGGEDAAVATAIAERVRLERIVVATGQVLIEIEREILEAQVREADAAVEAARVELDFAEVERGRMKALREQGAASHQKLADASAR